MHNYDICMSLLQNITVYVKYLKYVLHGGICILHVGILIKILSTKSGQPVTIPKWHIYTNHRMLHVCRLSFQGCTGMNHYFKNTFGFNHGPRSTH